MIHERAEQTKIDPAVPTVVGGCDEYAIGWCARELGIPADHFNPARGLVVVYRDAVVASVIFNEYRQMPRGASMQASIASTSPKWCTRRVLRAVFSYPFGQMNVARLWASTARNNKRARRFLARLGFAYEGIARRAHDGVMDAAVYSMLPGECRWVR